MGSKVVYQCDAAGVFTGFGTAFESPIDEGVFHIPGGCVETAPPETSTGEAAVWQGDAWQVMPDHRGETWYLNGAATVISAVGDPGSQGYVPLPPPLSTPELKTYAAARRYAAETGGIVVDGVSILTDRESQRLIADAASYVEKYTVATVNFKSATGFVTLTAEQIDAIAGAVGAHVQASFSSEMAVAAAIDAGTITTTAEIDAAAWPATS